MKLVCIAIPPSFIQIKMEIGKVYNSFKINGYTYIEDDIGNVIPTGFKYFKPLNEVRSEKLEKLGI